MGFRWIVPPYETLQLLRQQYGTFLFMTTNNSASKIAPKAEAWMRENAPWKDRPDFRPGKDGQPVQVRSDWEISQGHAREGLTVTIERDKDVEADWQRALKVAKGRDVAQIRQLNRQREAQYKETFARQTAYAKSLGLSGPGDLSPAFKAELSAAQKKITSKTLSPSRSFVADFRRMEARRWPLVNLVFRHNSNLRYTIWLELAMGGRYAIIGPALDYWGPVMMREMQRIARLKQFGEVKQELESYIGMDFNTEEYQTQRYEEAVAEVERDLSRKHRPHTPEFQANSRRRSSYYQGRKKRTDNRKKYSKGNT